MRSPSIEPPTAVRPDPSPSAAAAPLVARSARAAPGLAVALVALGLAWAGPGPELAAPRPLACTRAGLVDGHLRCDDELPSEPAALCPGAAGPMATEPVAAGDSFVTAQLCARSFASPGEPGWARMSPAELAMLGQPVDIDTASLAELESLPRVGPKLARRIAEGRPYASVDALERVRGIGPATLALLRERVVVHGRTRPASP